MYSLEQDRHYKMKWPGSGVWNRMNSYLITSWWCWGHLGAHNNLSQQWGEESRAAAPSSPWAAGPCELGPSNMEGVCMETRLLSTSLADRTLKLTTKIPLNPALTVSLETAPKGSASAKEKATGKAFYHPKSTAEVLNKYHLELSCRPAAFPFRCRIYLTYRTAAANLGRLPASCEADHLHLQKILAAYNTLRAGGSMYKLITCLRWLDIFLN